MAYPPGKARRIGIVLLPAFNAMATVSFTDPFRAANYLAGVHLYKWWHISVTGDPVQASNGMRVDTVPLGQVSKEGFDYVLVSASWTPEKHRDPRLFHALREWDRRGCTLGGLDTGAFTLGFAGLLADRRATVHYEHIDSFRELFPEAEVTEDIFVRDRRRVTCCGGAATADLALELIREQHGPNLANDSARYIFHGQLRDGSEGQSPASLQPAGYAVPHRLRAAIVEMERNLEQPLRLPEVASLVGSSQRQLERLFHEHTGMSAVRYYLDIRLDRARGLITQTDLPVAEVALACGFSSPQHFSRSYKERFHISPQKDRVAGRVPFEFRAYPSHPGEAPGQ